MNKGREGDFPLPANDPKIMLMRAKDGPFKCANCTFYKGQGKPCAKTTALLNDGDCCNQFWPK